MSNAQQIEGGTSVQRRRRRSAAETSALSKSHADGNAGFLTWLESFRSPKPTPHDEAPDDRRAAESARADDDVVNTAVGELALPFRSHTTEPISHSLSLPSDDTAAQGSRRPTRNFRDLDRAAGRSSQPK